MSYLIQEPSNFLNIKLTDTGRRLLSLGQLTFDKVILSDREINYVIGRNGYDICSNKILSPKDDQPLFTQNFNGSSAVALVGQNVGSAKQIVSALTQSTGFFSGATDYFTIKTTAGIGQGKPLGTAVINYSTTIPSGGTEVYFTPGGYSAQTGDLVYIPWEPIQYSAITNSTPQIFSGRPEVALWYRVQGRTGNRLDLDRNVPNFGSAAIAGSIQQIQCFFYPYNGIETFYASSTTVNCGIWNMNIVRTNSEIGTTPSISGYTSYGAIEYNGTKQYLGFSSETRAFGIIHYTNKFSGNTYAEQLVPTTVEVEIPNIMWHNKANATIGQETQWGIKLVDSSGSSVFDSIANTSYRNLTDGTGTGAKIVGRVYHKLKIIIITDQELLTALTYKDNRNYTLPELNLSLSTSPKPPLNTTQALGLCKSDFSYYVTYITESNALNSSSFGYPQAIHCNYIGRIDGVNDSNSNPQYLTATFPVNSFPFMRNSTYINSLSGTGWNANKLQLMVKEIPTSAATAIGDVVTTDWKLISNGVGNGIYTGETGHTTIDPLYLQAQTFVISQQDYDSGTTYSLTGKYSAFTMNNDSFASSGLTFGDETFFYGNIKTGILSTVYKTSITVYARNDEFNSSNNITYDGTKDTNTFITEVGVLSVGGELVAVGKPSYPIKKNSSRFLAFQLEIDF